MTRTSTQDQSTRRSWRTPIIRVLAAATLGYLSVALAVPVLPGYVHTTLHRGQETVGIVMGMYAMAALVSRPVAGLLADRYGCRTGVYLGAVLLAIGGAGYLLSDTVAVLILDRAIVGIGLGALLSSATVWVVDLAPEDRHKWALGLVGLVNYGTLALGAPLGAALATYGTTSVWLACAALPLLGLSAIIGLQRSHTPPATQARPESSRGKSLEGLRSALLPGTGLALTYCGYAALSGFVVLALTDRGITHPATALTTYAIALVGTRLLSQPLVDKANPVLLLACSAGVEILGLVLVALASSLGAALLAAALVGIGIAQMYPLLGSSVLHAAPDRQRGSALATYSGFVDVGTGLGSPALGGIAATAGYTLMFETAALAAALGTVIGLILLSRRSHT